MFGIKGIRYSVKISPTPEQREQIKEYFEKTLDARGVPHKNGTLLGLDQEVLLTVDEALEAFKMAKFLEEHGQPEPGTTTFDEK